MKKTAIFFILLLSLGYMTGCTPLVQHADPFYNLNGSDYPRGHIPLINPVQVTRDIFSSAWNLKLLNSLHVDMPKSQEQEVVQVYIYSYVMELEKFSVKDGVIMAYSSYVDQQADAYIQNNYYHWFVMIPSQKVTKGFQTEDEFRQYIQTLGIQDPDWQTPEEAHNTFLDTGGCLDWIPDCK